MPNELIFNQQYGFTWKAIASKSGVTLTRASIGVEGRPYTVDVHLNWAEWERLAAWLNFQRADQAVKPVD